MSSNNKQYLKLIIGGDYHFSLKKKNYRVGNSLVELFKNHDYRILNLESPLTNSENRIIKSGPHLKSDSVNSLPILKTLNVDLVTLANNHIRDYGDKGIYDTLRVCNENSITPIGAGHNLSEAEKIVYLEKDGIKLAILNIAENEWSSATQTSAGSNPLDIVKNFKQIQVAKKESDHVIVIIHGGIEHYNLPSPKVQERYRFFVDIGASAVIAHHSHCISGHENYRNSIIFYSLGNFLFTNPSKMNHWYNGMCLSLSVTKEKIQWSEHFTHHNQQKIDLADSKLTDKLKVDFNKSSKIIANENTLNLEWDRYCELKKEEYLSQISFGNSSNYKLLRGIIKYSGLDRIFYSKRYFSFLLNLIRCESHLEVLLKTLEMKITRK